ncbi:hypothetical protein F4859DRAFT_123049 [Xylaria cf. heliscus]|nr:hypothetical protein F4859DRAFT_123049 [Xylaria cf. heliscus]
MALHQTALASTGEDAQGAMEIRAVESEKKVSDAALAAPSVNGSQKDLAEGEGEGLQRGLNSWHLQFIAIGSAIGTGLVSFKSSSSSVMGYPRPFLTCCSSSAAARPSRRQGLSGA